MTVRVSSQMQEPFNRALSARFPELVIEPASTETPWQGFEHLDVLLVRPTTQWSPTSGNAQSPPGWPGALRWICAVNAGIDLYPAWVLDVPRVSCGRGVTADQIADYVFAAIYCRTKDIAGLAVHSPQGWELAAGDTASASVAGSTIAILGFGAVGQAIARRGLALQMRVRAFRRRPLPSPINDVVLCPSAEETIAEADHIVIALPATPETKNLVNADLINHARHDAHLINVGRGAVLDHDALLTALDGGDLGFATLDVTEPEPLPSAHPFWSHASVRLTPHIASNHVHTHEALFAKIAGQFERFLAGEVPGDLVDKCLRY